MHSISPVDPLFFKGGTKKKKVSNPNFAHVWGWEIPKMKKINPKECGMLKKPKEVEIWLASAYVLTDCMPSCQISPLVQSGARNKSAETRLCNFRLTPSKRKSTTGQSLVTEIGEHHGCAKVPNAHPTCVGWEIDQRQPDQPPRMWCVGNRATELRIQWVVPMFWQIACEVVRSVP